jgi:regulator of sigma E protease
MLDGGRILFVLIEIARRGKRIAPEKEALVHLAGFALLLTFVIVVSYFDIARIVRGESLVR